MPAAAALLETILVEGYTPGMLRAAQPVVAELDSRAFVKVVAPRRFAVPRPQRPREHFCRILKWREEVEEMTSQQEGGFEQSEYEHLRYDGGYVEHAVARGRAVASLLEAIVSGGPAGDVPQWPPAIKQVVEASKNAGFGATLDSDQEQTFDEMSCSTPSSDGEVPAGFFIGRDGLEWPLPPRECMASPFEDFLRTARPGLQWTETSRVTARSPTAHMTEDVDREYTPSYFIGRDGTQWPLPPRECMTSTVLDLANVSRTTLTNTTASVTAPALPAYPSPTLLSPPGRNYDSGVYPQAWLGCFGERNGLPPLPSCLDPATFEIIRDFALAACNSNLTAQPGSFPGCGGLEGPPSRPLCLDPATFERLRDKLMALNPSPKGKPGFFAGRGGLDYPRPLPPGMSPATFEIHLELAAATHNPNPPQITPDGKFFIGRDGSEWPLPPLPPECLDLAVLDGLFDIPVPTSPVAGAADLKTHDSPASESNLTSSSLSASTNSTNSMLPPTPQCCPLELPGLRGLPVIHVGEDSPPARCAEVAVPENALSKYPSRCICGWGLDDAYAKCDANSSEGGFFRGRDGNLWPLPPPPPSADGGWDSDEDEDEEESGAGVGEEERWGRSPTPKWSMLRA